MLSKMSGFFYLTGGFFKGKKEWPWSNHNATYICGFGFKSRAWSWGSGGNIWSTLRLHFSASTEPA